MFKTFLALSLMLTLLSSCTALRSAGLAGMGAYAGSTIDDGGLGGSLLGAATGVAADAALNHWESKKSRTAFVDGYALGRSDEIKRLYWAQQRLHEAQDDTPRLRRRYYEIPVPAHEQDGVRFEAHTVVTDIIE